MGWVTDEGGHDGYAAAIFADGRVSIGSQGGPDGGALVRRAEPPGTDVVDGRNAIGWVGECSCGWRGPLWERVVSPDLHNLAGRSIHVSDPSPYGDPPAAVEDGIHAEWKHHLPPASLTELRRATADLAAAQNAQNAAVAQARRDGRSWTEIGKAAGVSRQAAHERWAHLIDTDTEAIDA